MGGDAGQGLPPPGGLLPADTGGPGPELRDVEPISLVYFGERWQVAGYCRLRRGPRLFRLDRIDHLNILAEQFSLGERHVVPPPSEDWKSRVPEARVRFDPVVERWVRER